MWSILNLIGNWEFQFKIHENCKNFGLLFQEVDDLNKSLKKYKLQIEPKVKNFIFNDKKISFNNYNQNKWNYIKVKKIKKEIKIFINNIEIYSIVDIPELIVLKSGLFYENGTVFIDNITAKFRPDLLYDFQYNKMWKLSLYGFRSNYQNLSHCNSTLSYLTLTNEDETPYIETKKKFRGNGIFRIMPNPGWDNYPLTKKLGISFVTTNFNYKILIQENKLSFLKNDKQLKEKNIQCLKGKQIRFYAGYPMVDIILKDNVLYLYYSSKEGFQKLLLKEKINFMPTYKLKISGSPHLCLHKLLISAKEVYEE